MVALFACSSYAFPVKSACISLSGPTSSSHSEVLSVSSTSPRFGIAHALCLGLAPWLAAEIPVLVDSGMIKHKDDAASSNES